MAPGREHPVVAAEIVLDRLRPGRRFDNHDMHGATSDARLASGSGRHRERSGPSRPRPSLKSCRMHRLRPCCGPPEREPSSMGFRTHRPCPAGGPGEPPVPRAGPNRLMAPGRECRAPTKWLRRFERSDFTGNGSEKTGAFFNSAKSVVYQLVVTRVFPARAGIRRHRAGARRCRRRPPMAAFHRTKSFAPPEQNVLPK